MAGLPVWDGVLYEHHSGERDAAAVDRLMDVLRFHVPSARNRSELLFQVPRQSLLRAR